MPKLSKKKTMKRSLKKQKRGSYKKQKGGSYKKQKGGSYKKQKGGDLTEEAIQELGTIIGNYLKDGTEYDITKFTPLLINCSTKNLEDFKLIATRYPIATSNPDKNLASRVTKIIADLDNKKVLCHETAPLNSSP